MIRELAHASALLLALSCADDAPRDGGELSGAGRGGSSSAGGHANAANDAGAKSELAGAPGAAGELARAGQPAHGGAPVEQGGAAPLTAGEGGATAGGHPPDNAAGADAGGGGAGSSGAGSGSGGTGEGGAGGSFDGGAAGLGGAGELPPPSLPCNIAAILKARCTTCHGDPPVNLAPMSLVAYDDVVTYALAMQGVVQEGVMPPAGAPQLSDEQSSTLVDYLSLGAPPSGKPPCP